MKKNIILIGLCFVMACAKAQQPTKQEKGYFNLTEFGYFTGNNTFEYVKAPNQISVTHDGAYALSLRNINGYFITNKITIGLGLGLENYTHKSDSYNYDNLFLMFFDARYYFKNSNNTFFAYGDVGTSLAIDDNIRKGPMFNLGGGYKLKVAERMALAGSIGFFDQSIKVIAPVTKNRYYGIAFKIGLLL